MGCHVPHLPIELRSCTASFISSHCSWQLPLPHHTLGHTSADSFVMTIVTACYCHRTKEHHCNPLLGVFSRVFIRPRFSMHFSKIVPFRKRGIHWRGSNRWADIVPFLNAKKTHCCYPSWHSHRQQQKQPKKQNIDYLLRILINSYNSLHTKLKI